MSAEEGVAMSSFDFSDWVGRQQRQSDQLSATPARALAATLDREESYELGDALPGLWHWLYFLPLHRQSELGVDGHAKRGGFLPPVPLPRRMWAGGQLNWHQPLKIGDSVERVSTIKSVTHKSGKTGDLVFVAVEHAISNAQGLAMTEVHDIVYRGNPPASAHGAPMAAGELAPTDADFERSLTPDDVLLFRYSALTFNGHRIHYDRRYVTTEEGYPGLVVHGPLIATLLVDLVRRQPGLGPLRSFDFRAIRPTFDGQPMKVCGKSMGDGQISLWAQDHQGFVTMKATAVLAA
ncbi:MAG: FAS1-like dehydratase domain-containing protein [Burkholderiaceae bacterium]